MTPQQLQTRIGLQIRALRARHGLSQKQLATLTGLAVPALSRIENGRRDVKLSTLLRLAEALRADVATLLAPESPGDSPPVEPPQTAEGYDLDPEE